VYDKIKYTRRNRVERFFNKLKQFRRIATRYEKHAFTFLGFMTSYILLIPFLGYMLASLLYMPAAMWLLKYRRPVVIVALTAGWLAFSEFVFRQMLYVDLPTGVLWRNLPFL
jgi:hypothetical protein